MDKLIFISNDDGFAAEGLNQLAEMMRQYGDVFVVAPDSGRSGASMSISSHTPVKNKLIKQEPGTDSIGRLTVWACTGTPNDCTKMAFEVQIFLILFLFVLFFIPLSIDLKESIV